MSKRPESETYLRVIDAISRNVDEKIFQLSQMRLLAETLTIGLQGNDYFDNFTRACLEIFECSLCAFYMWHPEGEEGWHLISFASDDEYLPNVDVISGEEENLLGWIRVHKKPLRLESGEDASILKYWAGDFQSPTNLVIMPLDMDECGFGALFYIEKKLFLSPENIEHHLEIVTNLLTSGLRNRCLYEHVQESEQKYRDLFTHSSSFLILLDTDGRIIESNKTFKDGLHLEEWPYLRKIEEFVHADDRKFFSAWCEALNNTDEVRHIDVRLVTTSGKTRETETTGYSRFLSGTSKKVILLSFGDVTEKRHQEREKRKLEIELVRQEHLAQIGLLLTGIIHNLKNPITAILGYAEFMKMAPDHTEGLDAISRSAHKMKDMVANLLHKVREEQSNDISQVDINQLVRSEITYFEANSFFKNKIEKSYELAEILPCVKGVYRDFSQILNNVLSNAVDALRDTNERKLTLRTRVDEDGENVLIEVEDTGPGIPEDVQPHIFDPFYTTKSKDSEASAMLDGGTGLGLAYCLSTIKNYGGSIEFNVSPDAGTLFIIRLPVISKIMSSEEPAQNERRAEGTNH